MAEGTCGRSSTTKKWKASHKKNSKMYVEIRKNVLEDTSL
jgi:hypothetical protein